MRKGLRHKGGNVARGARKLVAVVVVEGLGILAVASLIGLPLFCQSSGCGPIPVESSQPNISQPIESLSPAAPPDEEVSQPFGHESSPLAKSLR